MPEFDADITAYYERGDEEGRLRGWGRLEFVRTQELLERFLPPPAVVLNVGGGPGAYAAWLAGRGYEVHLLDPVALHVEQARGRAGLASVEVGDARALPFGDASADAVLLLGPLYHLVEAGDRLRALGEACRVLRLGGLLAAAAITRFAATIDGLLKGYLADPEFEAVVERDLDDGRHVNPTRNPGWFTTAYFHLPDDLAREVREAGFELSGLLAVEGVGGWLTTVDEWLDDAERRGALLRAIRRVESEPTLLGSSAHILAVGVRR
jgi:ubiquinone/menaquinone biosynthesis C-methylase UbiE